MKIKRGGVFLAQYNQFDYTKISEEEEFELWTLYKTKNDQKAREILIIKYAPLVKYVAGKIAIGMPKKIDFDDLVGYGTFGLLDALDKFDLSRNIKFKTYAITRIRGAIFDELRADDWVPRTIRQKAKQLDKVLISLENELDRTPTDSEVAESMEMTEKELQKLYLNLGFITVSSFYDPIFNNDSDSEQLTISQTVEGDESYNPEMISEKEEIQKIISNLIETLSEKEKQVLILYYYEDLTLKEIGQVLQVTESRVSQLHTKAIFKLRAKLRKIQKQIQS
jgi:RNA polymerase sigma factor for flagellar operon FliA